MVENTGKARGAATVEAVVVLPVFVALFVGVFYVRDLTGGRLAADEAARRCAWQYSANSCENIPEGCEQVLQGVHRGSIAPELERTIEGLEKNLSSDSEPQQVVKNLIQTMVTDALAKYLTRALSSKKTVELNRPRLFGGGKSLVAGSYRLACNIPLQKSKHIAKAAWNQFRPGGK